MKRNLFLSSIALGLVITACAPSKQAPTATAPIAIAVDGSSTVYPITEAVAEEFQKKNPTARTTVGVAGTGGGFKKFCRGEIDISNASRPIKKEEHEACTAEKISYIELPVAYDGLAIVVNPKNTWVSTITVAELKRIWEPEAQGKIMKWNQVRPEWPDREIHLFGAGVDSGTFDYFTEAIVGKAKSSRGDYTASEDDNVLVQGVSGDENALGFFGLAYYEENQSKLKIVPVDDEKDDNGKGGITPSRETVSDATYQPLSRPLFIYVNSEKSGETGLKSFVEFYLDQAPALVDEVGYIALSGTLYDTVQQRFQSQKTGSLFLDGRSQVGINLEAILKE